MSRLNSFFLSPEDWPSVVGESVTLNGPEARHMGTVLRTATDSQVRLFDGTGNEGLFKVDKVSKNRAELTAETLETSPEADTGLTLAVGWGKSKRRSYLFEKTVELRGHGVIFWQAGRSQGNVPGEVKDTWTDKCVQAAKQCFNPHLPELLVMPGGVRELVEHAGEFDRCLLAWESEEATVSLSPSMLSGGSTLIVIGPEGGFDADEADALIRSGFEPVTLGNSILRWETACAYCLSLAMFATQDAS